MFGKGVFGLGRKKVEILFEGFSRDAKRRVEEVKRLRKGIEETQMEGWKKI